MSRHPLRAPAAALLALACAALLGACGSQTTTVTVASTPNGTTQSTAPAATTTSTTTSTVAPEHTSTEGTATQSTVRTAPEPAFTQGETHAEGLPGALATVRSLGYTPQDPAEYHAGQTLRVLVGTRTGSSGGYGQLAFFFAGNHYIGTDVRVASAKISVVSQGESEVTIAYPLYRHGDPLCCPGAGQARVRFQLNNGRLQALDPIPQVASVSGVSRK